MNRVIPKVDEDVLIVIHEAATTFASIMETAPLVGSVGTAMLLLLDRLQAYQGNEKEIGKLTKDIQIIVKILNDMVIDTEIDMSKVMDAIENLQETITEAQVTFETLEKDDQGCCMMFAKAKTIQCSLVQFDRILEANKSTLLISIIVAKSKDPRHIIPGCKDRNKPKFASIAPISSEDSNGGNIKCMIEKSIGQRCDMIATHEITPKNMPYPRYRGCKSCLRRGGFWEKNYVRTLI